MSLAPVYRNIEERTTFLGLNVPLEVGLVFGAWFGCIALLPPSTGLLAMAAVYAAVRLSRAGKPEGHLQHWLQWKVRQWQTGGCLSAAARARTPRFPYAPYAYRDVPRRGRKA